MYWIQNTYADKTVNKEVLVNHNLPALTSKTLAIRVIGDLVILFLLKVYVMYVIVHKKQPNSSKEKHEHRWRVVSDYWQCEICGKTFGLKMKY